MVKCLIERITDPDELVKRAHTRTKNKHGTDVIRESLNSVVTQVNRDMMALYMEELELYHKQQEECLVKMMELCNQSYARNIALLTTIPGIKPKKDDHTAELGNDISAFKTSPNLVGWAGLRPRNDESAGKIKSRKIMHGNMFLRVILVQCARANTQTKSS